MISSQTLLKIVQDYHAGQSLNSAASNNLAPSDFAEFRSYNIVAVSDLFPIIAIRMDLEKLRLEFDPHASGDPLTELRRAVFATCDDPDRMFRHLHRKNPNFATVAEILEALS